MVVVEPSELSTVTVPGWVVDELEEDASDEDEDADDAAVPLSLDDALLLSPPPW